MVDANGNATDYVFDASGNVLSETQHLDAQTPVTWSYTYNNFNQVLTSTDPLGVVTKNEYDVKGNLTCTSPDAAATTCSKRGQQDQVCLQHAGPAPAHPDHRSATVVDSFRR